MSKRFSNRANTPYQVAPGKTVFDSRSVAVLALVVAHVRPTRTFHVLAGKRGSAVDHTGQWCMVCGYLDWDESLDEAARREVFEEAGLDLVQLEAAGLAVVPEQPIFVRGTPSTHRQNVTAQFPIELCVDVLPQPSTENAEENEVDEIAWLDLDAGQIDARKWAFGHELILHELAAWITAERDRGAHDEMSFRRYFRSKIEARYPFV